MYAAHSCRSINTYARVMFGVLDARWDPYASTKLANSMVLHVVVGIRRQGVGLLFRAQLFSPLVVFLPVFIVPDEL